MPATVWHDPGGTLVDGDVNCDTVDDIMNDVLFHLDAVGWVEQSVVYSSTTGTFTGVPTNNQTVTVAGHVYTFKTTLTGAADEVLIGGTATACAANLTDAIEDNTGNEGTTYGTGTAANATCDASSNAGVITVTRKPGVGDPWDSFTVAEGLSNFTWAAATAFGGGSIMVSERNVEGLQYAMRIVSGSATSVYFYPRSEDGTVESDTAFKLDTTAARVLKMNANKYGFMTRLAGSTNVSGTTINTGLIKPRAGQVGLVIATVANNGSGLIRITTATAHGLSTGQTVFITGGTNTGDFWSNLNDSFTVTVINTTTLDLDGSTYASGYDADSGFLGDSTRLSRAFYMQGDWVTGTGATWRNSLAPASVGSSPYCAAFVCANENAYFYSQGVFSNTRVTGLCSPMGAYDNCPVIDTWGPKFDWYIPRIGWPVVSQASEFFWIGDLYACAVIQHDVDMDVTLTNFDEANWLNYTNNAAYGTLMIVTTRSV